MPRTKSSDAVKDTLRSGDTSAHVKTSKIHRIKSSDLLKGTPLHGESSTHLKTPVVTGAWIDTPKPATLPTQHHQGPSLTDEGISASDKVFDVTKKEKDDQDDEALKQSAPKLPRSALAAIIEQAKNAKSTGGDDTLQLNDSTILSLEDLQADPSRQITSDMSTLPAELAANAASPNAGGPSAGNVTNSLASSLSHLRNSLAESKNDVGTITKRLHRSSSAPAMPSGTVPAGGDGHECDEGGVVHDFIIPCEKCAATGRLSTSDAGGDSLFNWGWHWQSLALPMPRLWRYGKSADRAPQPTRLAWCLFVLFLLFVAECVTAPAYTPPFYADEMVGYGVDITRPRPPFVFLKLVAQRTGVDALATWLWYVVCVLVRVLAGVLGVDAGIFGHGDGGGDGGKWVFTHGVTLDSGFRGSRDLGFDADEVL